MKCKECIELGQKSEVRPDHYGATTGWAYAKDGFYDEDGKSHYHDAEVYHSSYSCSNGHKFTKKRMTECESCNYGSEFNIQQPDFWTKVE